MGIISNSRVGSRLLPISLLAILFTLLFALTVQAATIKMQIGSQTMLVDGSSQRLDAAPYIKDGRTMVPLSAIALAFGANVSAYGTESGLQARIEYQNVQLFLTVGDQGAHFVNEFGNDTAVHMDVASEIVNNRMCVPLSFIARGFGAEVDWNPASQTATITSGGQSDPQEIDLTNPMSYLPTAGYVLHYYVVYPDGEEGYETLYTRKPAPESMYMLDTATVPDIYGGDPDYKHHYVAVQDGIYELYETSMLEDIMTPWLKDGLYAGQTWSYQGDSGNIYWKVAALEQTVNVSGKTFANCLAVEVDNQAVGLKYKRWYAPGLGLVKEQSMPGGSLTQRLEDWTDQ
ncbi:MAG: copper amine oxidase N-terminal domain-containing protein [Syntrophomonas sp.]